MASHNSRKKKWKNNSRVGTVFAVLIASASVLSFGCTSDDTDLGISENPLTSTRVSLLEELKLELQTYDATPDDDGVIYMSEIVDGVEVSTGRTRTVLTNVCPDTWYIVINPKDTVDREQPIFYNITFWQDGHPQDV